MLRSLIMSALLMRAAGFSLARRAPLAATGKAGLRMAATVDPASAEADSKLATGKVAIVTGSSRGLGKAIALSLAAEGCRVVVNYARSAGPAEEVVNEIKAMGNGADAVAVQADCGKEEEVKKLFAACEETWGEGQSVDILVNNAGITRDGLAIRMSEAQFREVIDVNLVGVFLVAREAANLMLRKRSGRIINVSSVVGQIGNAGQANYASAKAGVIGMTMSMAREFAKRKVLVNAVCPGFIASDMTDEIPEEIRDKVVNDIPLGRFGSPEEVAGMVKFLAVDPAAGYITGHCFNVDGGIAIGA
eukprot:scaffold1620_cov233-Pinguiococcus_pyrenoidosus.AAC.17